ncbi:MAG TPA: hypothetical protein VFQ42_19165 [Mycobacterium sp.]|nr:hypothetical protein [Mycobacterium sp.]
MGTVTLTAAAAWLDEAAIGFLHCFLQAEGVYGAPTDLGITTEAAMAAIRSGVAAAR